MLKFQVFDDGKPAQSCVIRNAHLIGSDRNAMRGTITFEQGLIVCEKRESGVAALALQQQVGECGELTIQTCLLPERDEPYLLSVELARHRLMILYNKLEDWGMFEIGGDHPVTRRLELARKLFVEALCLQQDEPQRADKLARDCLVAAIDGSEELALAHAELLLARRRSTGALPKNLFGGGVRLDQSNDRLRGGLQANFDFVCVPTAWKDLAPEESEYRWGPMDNWVEWANRHNMPVVAGPVISFEPGNLPDWLFIWEHDYETVRDLIYEHLERVVTRYKSKVSAWTVVSGLHINDHFTFAFEQLMDLTRMATMLVKKIQPQARVMVEIRQPFGEYFAHNPRSIPPLMYADLLVQGAINFDAFSLKLLMGQALPGQFTRDLMQVSNLLDQFSPLGKPVHLVLAAPSDTVTSEMIVSRDSDEPVDANCGHWRKPWSPMVQSHWLEALLQVAVSKPFVESISWHELMDHANIEMPLGGLINESLQPKNAFRRLVTFRQGLLNGAADQQASSA